RSTTADDPGQRGQVVDDRDERGMTALAVDPDVLEDLAAEADQGGRERVDLDVEGKDQRPIRCRVDQGRRPARRSEAGGAALADEASGDELADQAADRAPGEAGPRDEAGSRHRPAGVELADDRAEIRAPDRLAPQPGLVANGGHEACVPPAQIGQTVPRRARTIGVGGRAGWRTA